MKNTIEKIKEEYFTSQYIKIGNFVGTKANRDKNTLTIGDRYVSDETDPDHLIHEMCHLVTVSEERLTKNNWGYLNGTPSIINGKVYNDKLTDQHVYAELDVFAYQKHLCDKYDLPYEVEKSVDLAIYFENHIFSKHKNKYIEYLENKINTTSLEEFEKIWFDRISRLNDIFNEEKNRVKTINEIASNEYLTETETYNNSEYEYILWTYTKENKTIYYAAVKHYDNYCFSKIFKKEENARKLLNRLSNNLFPTEKLPNSFKI